MASSTGTLLIEIGADVARLRGDMGKATGIVNSATNTMKTAFKAVAVAAVSAFAIRGIKDAAKEATEFGKAMSEVSTLLSDTSSMKGLTKEVERLSLEFGKAPVEESKALYQIISAGASDATEAIDILTVANRLAIGGVTDVKTAADGLTTVLNAYGDAAGTATDVSDAMFVAMRAGKTTIGELSASIGTIAPLASQIGIAFDEVLAATAALTKGGITTSEAMTGLQAIMAAVVKQEAGATEAAKELGLEFNATALKTKGLGEFLDDLKKKTGGNSETLAELFGRIQALQPVMALTGNLSKDFAQVMKDMGNKAGETTKAFDKMAEDAAFKFDRVKAAANVMGIVFGRAVLDVLVPAVDILLDNFDAFQSAIHIAGNLFRGLGQIAIGVAAAFNGVGIEIAGILATIDTFISEGPEAAAEVWKAMVEENQAAAERWGAALDKMAFKAEDTSKRIKNAADLAKMRQLMAALGEDLTSTTKPKTKTKATTPDLFEDEFASFAEVPIRISKANAEIEQAKIDLKKTLAEFDIQTALDYDAGWADGISTDIKNFSESAYTSFASLSENLNGLFNVGAVSAAIEVIRGGLGELQADLEGRQEFIQTYQDMFIEAHRSMYSYAAEGASTIYSGLSTALSGIITGATTAREAFKALGQQMIKMVVDWLVQRAVAFALSKVMEVAATAAAVFTGGAIAKAYAPAAAFVSLASFGANAAPAAAALAGTVGLAQSLAIGGAAHAGLENVPSDSTFLLKKGERVVASDQNRDLTDFLKGNKGDGGAQVIELHVDGDRWFRWINDGIREGKLQLRPA